MQSRGGEWHWRREGSGEISQVERVAEEGLRPSDPWRRDMQTRSTDCVSDALELSSAPVPPDGRWGRQKPKQVNSITSEKE